MIHGVLVIRQRKGGSAAPKKTDKEKETNSRYLLIFLRRDLTHTPTIEDHLLFLDRAGSRNKIRHFKSLFTVQQTLKRWGFHNFHVLDCAHMTAKEAVEALEKVVHRKGPYRGILEFFEKNGITEATSESISGVSEN